MTGLEVVRMVLARALLGQEPTLSPQALEVLKAFEARLASRKQQQEAEDAPVP